MSGHPQTTVLSDVDLLSRLVAIDTTSDRDNIEAIAIICDYLDRSGVRLTRIDASPGKQNLIIEVGPPMEDPAMGLTLSGHLDCVPIGTGWSSDPFTLSPQAGRLVGRGSCDMKGFDALAINAMAAAAQGTLTSPLAMVLTCDEEVGGLGAAALVESWPDAFADDHRLPTATLIGEPTQLQVIRMHKGHLKFRVVFQGAAGHSGNPASGRNAIELAGQALGDLTVLASDFATRRTDTSEAFDDVPHPVLAIVGIDGGAAWNIIPEACEIRCGLRVMPDQSPAGMLDEIRSKLRASLGDENWELVVFNDNPPLHTGIDSAIHRDVCEIAGQDEGRGVSFCSDGGHLARLGLECVLWGPGSIEQAHQPDEFIDAAEFQRGRTLLNALIVKRCGAGAIA